MVGKIVKVSNGPEPFSGYEVKEPHLPPQPGEVLLKYEVETVRLTVQQPRMDEQP